MKHPLACLLLAVAACGVSAREALPLAADPEVERRLTTLAAEMRCLVCQNESLADSRSALAQDLRRELREQIRQGRSDEQIRAFMVERYGDFVLYRPPLNGATLLLWAGPLGLLALGLGGLVLFLRSRPAGSDDDTPPADPPLTEARR